MFAGCVDLEKTSSGADRLSSKNPTQSPGDQLIKQAQTAGLAGIPFDDLAIWQEGGATLIQQRQWHTPECRQEKGVMGDEFLRILFWGRIDNRKGLITALGDTAIPELIATDTGLVLNAWKRWGPECCEQLIGDFAFVVYQPRIGHVFLARDHFGVKPLYIYRTGKRLFFATSLAILAELDAIELTPSRQWMARYILGISPDWRSTAYDEVEKIQPAHCLLWSTEELSREQMAWYRFESPPPIELQSEEAYVRAYRDLLDGAVRDRLRAASAIGAECSGGLDSSAICASAASQLQEATGLDPKDDLGLFAMTFHRDEPEAVALAAANVKHHFLYLMDDLEEDIFRQAEQEYAQTVGCPPEHGNAIAQAPFYREAQKRGTAILLSGFGGDEFSSTYATMALVDLWRQRKWRLWASRFRGDWLGSKLRMLKWLFRYLCFGPGTETSRRLLRHAQKTWSYSPLSREAIWPELREQYMQSFRYDAGAKSLNDFVLNDRLSPMISARLESCTLMAARYGIEYRWPLLDIRLVEFFLAVPPEHKLGRGGIGRFLHRRAINDLLPPELVWRDKDMGPAISAEEHCEYKNKININNNIEDIINVDSIEELQKKMVSKDAVEAAIAGTYIGQIQALNGWLESRTTGTVGKK